MKLKSVIDFIWDWEIFKKHYLPIIVIGVGLMLIAAILGHFSP